jgi:hypothetical protein
MDACMLRLSLFVYRVDSDGSTRVVRPSPVRQYESPTSWIWTSQPTRARAHLNRSNRRRRAAGLTVRQQQGRRRPRAGRAGMMRATVRAARDLGARQPAAAPSPVRAARARPGPNAGRDDGDAAGRARGR